jgi:hypothetical protein
MKLEFPETSNHFCTMMSCSNGKGWQAAGCRALLSKPVSPLHAGHTAAPAAMQLPGLHD